MPVFENTIDYNYVKPFIADHTIEPREDHFGHCHDKFCIFLGDREERREEIKDEIAATRRCLAYFTRYLQDTKRDDINFKATIAAEIAADNEHIAALEKLKPTRCVIS